MLRQGSAVQCSMDILGSYADAKEVQCSAVQESECTVAIPAFECQSSQVFGSCFLLTLSFTPLCTERGGNSPPILKQPNVSIWGLKKTRTQKCMKSVCNSNRYFNEERPARTG